MPNSVRYKTVSNRIFSSRSLICQTCCRNNNMKIYIVILLCAIFALMPLNWALEQIPSICVLVPSETITSFTRSISFLLRDHPLYIARRQAGFQFAYSFNQALQLCQADSSNETLHMFLWPGNYEDHHVHVPDTGLRHLILESLRSANGTGEATVTITGCHNMWVVDPVARNHVDVIYRPTPGEICAQ
jgi:hypothetical protein